LISRGAVSDACSEVRETGKPALRAIVLLGLSVVTSSCVRLLDSSVAPPVDATADAPGPDTTVVDVRRGDLLEDQLAPADSAQVDPLSPFTGIAPVVALNTPSSDEEEPTLTADMLEIYFSRDQEIWCSKRSDLASSWSAPVPLITGSFPYSHPSVSADGLLLLYSSDESAQYRENINAMQRASRADPWGEPAPVVELNTTEKELAGGMTPDKRLLVLMRTEKSDFNLFLTTRGSAEAPWGTPQPIDALSSPGTENRPWISPAATVIYFDSDRPGAAMRDIFVSVRPDPAATWGPPAPLTSLNTSADDSDVWLSPDLRTIYFSSDRNGGSMEIFVATRQ
jgi:hypothetical protein